MHEAKGEESLAEMHTFTSQRGDRKTAPRAVRDRQRALPVAQMPWQRLRFECDFRERNVRPGKAASAWAVGDGAAEGKVGHKAVR